MKTYKIRIKLEDDYFDFEMEGNNWEEVSEYVFSNIEIIDLDETKVN